MDLKVLESLTLKFLMHGLLVSTSAWRIIMNDHYISSSSAGFCSWKCAFPASCLVRSVPWTSCSQTQTYSMFAEHMHACSDNRVLQM